MRISGVALPIPRAGPQSTRLAAGRPKRWPRAPAAAMGVFWPPSARRSRAGCHAPRMASGFFGFVVCDLRGFMGAAAPPRTMRQIHNRDVFPHSAPARSQRAPPRLFAEMARNHRATRVERIVRSARNDLRRSTRAQLVPILHAGSTISTIRKVRAKIPKRVMAKQIRHESIPSSRAKTLIDEGRIR